MPAELRPAHLDDWLDTLPYANPGKSLDMMLAALIETRTADLKTSVRFELLELYWHRYRFLLNVTIRADASKSALAPGQRPILLPKLREVALELGRGCNQTLKGAELTARNLATTLFRVGQRQSRTALLGITAHAHALLLGLEAYITASDETWRDLHAIFTLAENGMFLDDQLPDPDRPDRRTTPRRAYARICACVLAQPLQLDPGAIWLAYDLLADWNDDIELICYQPPADPRGVFVIDPARAQAPIDLRKVDPIAPTPRWHMLRCGRLAQRCQIELGRQPPPTGLTILDQQRARTRLLEHLAKQWGDAPRRRRARRAATGQLHAILGLRDVQLVFDGSGQPPSGATEQSWQLLNSSDDGAAVAINAPATVPRVGELLALRFSAREHWTLATVRWLRQEQAGRHSVGVQIIGRAAQAALIHAVTGTDFQTQPRPALLLPAEAGQQESLLTSPGLYMPDLRLLLLQRVQRLEIAAGTLIERTATFDRFTFK